jgi:hypothetical protein
MKQYDEFSAFCCPRLSDSMLWDKFQLAIQYVLSKCVIDVTKYSDDVCHLQIYVKENLKNQNILLSCTMKNGNNISVKVIMLPVIQQC